MGWLVSVLKKIFKEQYLRFVHLFKCIIVPREIGLVAPYSPVKANCMIKHNYFLFLYIYILLILCVFDKWALIHSPVSWRFGWYRCVFPLEKHKTSYAYRSILLLSYVAYTENTHVSADVQTSRLSITIPTGLSQVYVSIGWLVRHKGCPWSRITKPTTSAPGKDTGPLRRKWSIIVTEWHT